MLRVRTIFTGVAGTPWYSNMYFSGVNELRAAEAVAAVGQFWAAFAPDIYGAVSAQVQTDVPVIDPADGSVSAFLEVTGAPSIDFTGSGDPLPYANQLLINVNTNVVVNSRRVRGKIYIPGCQEEDSALGLPVLALRNAADARGEGLVEDGLVVWSRPIEPSDVPGAPAPRAGQECPAIGVTVPDKWAVIRSRRD